MLVVQGVCGTAVPKFLSTTDTIITKTLCLLSGSVSSGSANTQFTGLLFETRIPSFQLSYYAVIDLPTCGHNKLSVNMDSGLSVRMDTALKELLPRTAAHAPPKNYNITTAIDLSNAQNEVLRKELQEFFTTMVENKLESQVCALQIL